MGKDLASLVKCLLLGLLLFPYFILLFKLGGSASESAAGIGSVLYYTLWHASVGTLVSVSLGIVGAFGLIRHSGTRLRILQAICLVPSMLPVLFVIISTLNVITAFARFPYGWWGIVIIHSMMNIGLVAVVVCEWMRHRVGGWCELALVEGASRWQFLKVVLRYLAKDRDLYHIAFFLMITFFMSFSAPLIVGGGDGTTFEVYVYQMVHVYNDWPGAVSLTLIMGIMVLAISFLIPATRPLLSTSRFQRLDLLAVRGTDWLLISLSILVLVGLTSSWSVGLNQFLKHQLVNSDFSFALLGTVVVATLTGVLTVCFLLALAYVAPTGWLGRIVVGYTAPSVVLMGLALLLFGPNQGFLPFIKIPLGLAILSLPSLYRLVGQGRLSSLEAQVTVAQTLGADRSQVFRYVTLPQVILPFCALGAMAGFWAAGDYALSTLLAPRDITLGLMIKTFLHSYRLELATFFLWILLGVAMIIFFCFLGVGSVLRRKFSA